MSRGDGPALLALTLALTIGGYLWWRKPRSGWATFALVLIGSTAYGFARFHTRTPDTPWCGPTFGLLFGAVGYLIWAMGKVARRSLDDTWPTRHDAAGRMPTRSKTFRPWDDQ